MGYHHIDPILHSFLANNHQGTYFPFLLEKELLPGLKRSNPIQVNKTMPLGCLLYVSNRLSLRFYLIEKIPVTLVEIVNRR